MGSTKLTAGAKDQHKSEKTCHLGLGFIREREAEIVAVQCPCGDRIDLVLTNRKWKWSRSRRL